MNKPNTADTIFDEILLFGKPVLWAEHRVDSSTLPKGYYKYEVRETEAFSGIACELGKRIAVNFLGTVLSNRPIKLGEDGFRCITEDDFDYADGRSLTMREYTVEHPPIRKSREMER